MHSSAHIQLDDSLWPLLLIRYTGEATNQELQELLDVRTRYLERPEPCVVLHDMSRAKVGTTEQRRIQADWLKRHDAQLRKSVLGVAFVTSSVAMRLILSIILHLKPLSMPQSAFSHLPEALAFLAVQLQRAGMHAQAQRILEHSGACAEQHLH